jgi:phosphotriesterase-related protein
VTSPGGGSVLPAAAPLVHTVLGPVPAAAIGPTLMHEHLLIENPSFVEPSAAADRERAHQAVDLTNLGWIRRHWTSNVDNLILDDEWVSISEVAAFVAAGGGTIVDATVPGIGRDAEALARISRAAGVHIVMGSGAYVGPTHPAELAELDETQIAERLIGEWRTGIGETGIRPGFIGEIGCSWPMWDRERIVLRAAALAQRSTGATVMVHPGRDRAAPIEIIGILREAGADLGRVVIAHLDRTIQDRSGLLELAATGVYLEFDCFGLEGSFYPFDPTMATLSDAQRLELVRSLLDAGLGDRILLSQDICTKHRLTAYGGHGYGHLLAEVVPWMWQRGFTIAETTTILVDNPARVLGVTEA